MTINDEKILEVLNDYLNNCVVVSDKYEDNVMALEEIIKAFRDIDIDYSAYYMSLLNNSKLSSLIDQLCKGNDSFLRTRINYSNDDILVMLLEGYCLKRGIEVEEEFDELVDDDISDTSDIVHTYLHEASKYPLLSTLETEELIARAQSGDKEARNKLINSNLRLVVSIAKRYLSSDVPFLDLVQEGNIGLMNTIDKFDLSMGYKFSTYATWWIKHEISRALHELSGHVKIPMHLHFDIAKYTKVVDMLSIKLEREPKLEEVAEEMNISVSKTILLSQLKNCIISLNEKVNNDYNDVTELLDFIEDDFDVDKEFEKRNIVSDTSNMLKNIDLTDKERMVVLLRFGFSGRIHTLEEIGKKWGYTKESIRQIESKALSKIICSSKANALTIYMDDPDRALLAIERYRESVAFGKKKNNIVDYYNGKSQNLYEQLSSYPKLLVDNMLSKLSYNERKLLKLRYGDDFTNPLQSDLWNDSLAERFYKIVPRMLKTLKTLRRNPGLVLSSAELKALSCDMNNDRVLIDSIIEEEKSGEFSLKFADSKQINLLDSMLIPVSEMTDFMKVPEAVLAYSRLNVSEGEYDTDQDVASEYGVSAVTVRKATLKVLNMYKEKIYKSNETTLDNGFQKVKKTNE